MVTQASPAEGTFYLSVTAKLTQLVNMEINEVIGSVTIPYAIFAY